MVYRKLRVSQNFSAVSRVSQSRSVCAALYFWLIFVQNRNGKTAGSHRRLLIAMQLKIIVKQFVFRIYLKTTTIKNMKENIL